MGFLSKLFPSKNDRIVRKYQSRVGVINRLEEELHTVSADVLRQKTADWKERLSTIEDKKELARELESLLPEAFAVVKNACRRLCGTKVHVRGNDLDWEMIPSDVQPQNASIVVTLRMCFLLRPSFLVESSRPSGAGLRY